MVDGAENAILIEDVVYLLIFDNLLLFHDLDAAVGSILLLADEADLAKGTCIGSRIPSPRMVRYS